LLIQHHLVHHQAQRAELVAEAGPVQAELVVAKQEGIRLAKSANVTGTACGLSEEAVAFRPYFSQNTYNTNFPAAGRTTASA
jgi:hypothetical protein